MNNLNHEMQKRLDEWRKHTRPVTSAEMMKKIQNYVARRDYGDEMIDPNIDDRNIKRTNEK